MENNEIRDLLTGDLSTLLDYFLQIDKIDGNIKSQVLVLKARLNDSNKERIKNTISSEEFQRRYDQIRSSAIEIALTSKAVFKEEDFDDLKINSIDKKNETKSRLIKIFLFASIVAVILIFLSTFFDFHALRIFFKDVSNEQIKNDLIGEQVYTKQDTGWIFLSKDNFQEFKVVNEKFEGNHIDKTIDMRLLDLTDGDIYHMKLFVRYEFFLYFWDIEICQPLQFTKLHKGGLPPVGAQPLN